MKRKALGRGLGLAALVPTGGSEKEGLLALDIGQVIPNRHQPREVFDREALESLAESIKEHGLIQPVLVREKDHGQYELIAGERRLRAAKLAGLSKIPAILKEIDEQELMEWALLENIQREDLNPIEKAKAYENLISQFSLTQEEIAQRIGIDRSSVSNFLRLLQLPAELWDEISVGLLSMGHAKALLSLAKKEDQLKLALQIKMRTFSVRQAEAAVQQINKFAGLKKPKPTPSVNPDVFIVEDRLRQALGTKVRLVPHGNAGEIRIEYYSINDLERILEKIL